MHYDLLQYRRVSCLGNGDGWGHFYFWDRDFNAGEFGYAKLTIIALLIFPHPYLTMSSKSIQYLFCVRNALNSQVAATA